MSNASSRRAARSRRPRSHPRPRVDKFIFPSECDEQFKLDAYGLKRHKKRLSIYAATCAKLDVKPGGVLETCWCDVPSELAEIVASHLHPRDVARMRSVSTGWRATLWQECVMRASLRGCGRLVHIYLMIGMFSHGGGGGLKACFDQIYVGDRVCWRYVLDKTDWSEHVRATTQSTTTYICVAAVPFGTKNVIAQRFAAADLPRSINF